MNAERISTLVMYALLAIGGLVLVLGILGESYDPMLHVSYFYFIVAIVGALFSTVMGALAKPGSFKGSIVGILAMLAIVGISYALSSGEVMSYYPQGVTEGASKWSEAGLYTLYVLFFLTIGVIIYSGISKFLNR